jgi:archaellum biogenesis ATPase FlaH
MTEPNIFLDLTNEEYQKIKNTQGRNFDFDKWIEQTIKSLEKSKWTENTRNVSCDIIHKTFTFINKSFEEPKKKEKEERKLKYYMDKELINFTPPDQEWIIENLIPLGEIGLLGGKRGERKTFLALYLSVCCSAGIDCLNEKVTKKRKVLYIDEESGIYEIIRRAKAIKKGLGIENKILDICYISQEGITLDYGLESENNTPRKLKQMTDFYKLLEEFNPDLIIVDCLQRCLSFNIDKENQLVSEFFMGVVKEITNKYGCSWLFIHHLRKSLSNYKAQPEDIIDEIRGASELVNFPRFILLIQIPKNQEHGESEKAIVRVLKMSNSQKSEAKAVNFITEADSLKVEYLGIPEEVLCFEFICAKAIKNWLVENEIFREFRTKEVIEAGKELGYEAKSSITKGLNILIKDGFLIKVKRGVFRLTDNNSQKKLKT